MNYQGYIARIEYDERDDIFVRVPPEVHSRALIKAQSMGKSLNQWATEALERAVSVDG